MRYNDQVLCIHILEYSYRIYEMGYDIILLVVLTMKTNFCSLNDETVHINCAARGAESRPSFTCMCKWQHRNVFFDSRIIILCSKECETITNNQTFGCLSSPNRLTVIKSSLTSKILLFRKSTLSIFFQAEHSKGMLVMELSAIENILSLVQLAVTEVRLVIWFTSTCDVETVKSHSLLNRCN